MLEHAASRAQNGSGAHAPSDSPPVYGRAPEPSELEISASPLPAAPPALAVRAVLRLRRGLQRLTDMLAPAELAVLDHASGIAKSIVLGAVARHRIPDIVGSDAMTAEEIAQRTGLSADALHRTLRALATVGFFRLRKDGRFENTRLSRAIMSGAVSRMREFVMYYATGSTPASWLDFDRTLRTGESAFDRLHGMSVWDWYERNPDERELFAHVMMGLTMQHAPVIARVYPWQDVRMVCDVGGGRGSLLSELLVRHRHLSGVLCDAEGVLESAKKLLEARGVSDRAVLAPGNFFESVPMGADAYVLKNILHDWDDTNCLNILRVVREACSPGTRVLVCESLVDRGSQDILGTLADLHMMVACSNGRERGREEFRVLLEASGFRLERVFPYPTMAVLEGVAR
jgi:hypothetical protein